MSGSAQRRGLLGRRRRDRPPHDGAEASGDGRDPAPAAGATGAPAGGTHAGGEATRAGDGSAGDPPSGFAVLGGIVADLEAAGHTIRVSDATGGVDVPEELAVDIAWLLRAGADSILRRATAPVRVHIRVRVEGGELFMTMQSVNGIPSAPAVVLTESDVIPIATRAAAAGGRLNVRPTNDGNVIAIVRLPLSSD
ncbi:hypothetical protein [Patulibacter minatonensis]|uniref:hypothetical protein n=1 Tax=Patulibacter minatonensis TaxID=298163 RepID=UPI00047A05E0|nr:hypothetical protein [Patulibacter minatonensis]